MQRLACLDIALRRFSPGHISRTTLLVVCLALALLNAHSQNIASSQTEKMNALRERAEQGDAEAAYTLGSMNLNRPDPNYPEALRWYRKAADGGNAAARLQLGDMYMDGLGVKQDFTEAARLYGCPKIDEKIMAACPKRSVDLLPLEASRFVRAAKCDADEKYGTATYLSVEDLPMYTTCCHEFPHGECSEVLVARIAGTWKILGEYRGAWGCHELVALESVHAGFHDLCLPNVCSPGTGFGNKGCASEVQQFSKGKYRSVAPQPSDGK